MNRPTCLLMFLLLAGSALAQPAQREKVIVTAPKLHSGVTPNAIAHDFVKSFATPTALREAIARWRTAICPDFAGLAPQYAAVVEARFRTIAGEVGAAMKAKGCRRNLVVVFTPQPQAYLDGLHKKNPDALGYHGATTITHPIQAWYETGITDLDGFTTLDQDVMQASGDLSCDPSKSCWSLPISVVGGWRFHPDLTSDLLTVTIVVDMGQTSHYMLSEIADYVAMLALSRTEDYGDCQLLPSITNILSDNCDDKLKPPQITPSDLAYLRGVYKMDAGANLQIQQDQIAGEMAAAMAGGK